MKRAAILILALSLLACSVGEPAVQFDKTLTHPNGLTMERPVGFEESLLDDGFRFENGKPRYGTSFDLRLVDTLPEMVFTRGHIEVQYHIESGQYNGPPDYTLWMVKKSGSQWIVLDYHTQVTIGRLSTLQHPENLDPVKDFGLAWKFFEQVRLIERR